MILALFLLVMAAACVGAIIGNYLGNRVVDHFCGTIEEVLDPKSKHYWLR